MRTPTVLAILFVPGAALAGVPSPAVVVSSSPAVLPVFAATEIDDLPDPNRSICRLTGNANGCHFLFRVDGGLDRLTAFVTMRDAFDSPVVNCSASATISLDGPNGFESCWMAEAGGALASCDGLSRGAISDANGAVTFVWARLGGRGIAGLSVSAHCAGSWEVCRPQFHYTSSDLDGDGVTHILDLALWAGCLAEGTTCRASDYDCTCNVDVYDLALLAGGLGLAGCE